MKTAEPKRHVVPEELKMNTNVFSGSIESMRVIQSSHAAARRSISRWLRATAIAVAAGSAALPAASVRAGDKTRDSNAVVYSWNQAVSRVPMDRVDSHVCMLTGVWGELSTYGAVEVDRSATSLRDAWLAAARTGASGVDVIPREDSDVWNLDGIGNGVDISATAVCVPMADFIVDPGVTPQVSQRGVVGAITPIGVDCDKRVASISMWNGNAATFLGHANSFVSKSSRASVIETSPLSATTLEVQTTNCDTQIGSVAYSFLTASPDANRFPNYYPLGDPHFEVSNDHRVQRPLAPTSTAVCYFVVMGGELNGNGEWMRIEPRVIGGTEWWVLDANAVDGIAAGNVRCLNYDQRTLVVIEPD